jgi:hypothetical protein
MSNLTQERLREILDYDPMTGVFTARIARSSNLPVGAIAGCLRANGYITISICNQSYYGHRLAWLYVHGRWPDGEIDHINCIPSDNRLANLREATRAQNSRNMPVFRNNICGKKGVSKRAGKWRANITKNKRRVHLGYFDTPEEAHAAYAAAARMHYGEFART